MVRSVVHLENTFLSLFGDSGRHCPYVCCYDGMFPVLNIYIYIYIHTHILSSLIEKALYLQVFARTGGAYAYLF